ncbi:hypothetical protein GIB67_031335 [Kingdonia uniflora]|uniref:Fibronectin type III-like domain-containing protein n=1 Tax=Kingdonia uniflora TaxID=39325 RepID=A0A7J7MH33_9MAGN|nr:hypothetical protein GIB67_031335 [Kingdonia uniflora]
MRLQNLTLLTTLISISLLIHVISSDQPPFSCDSLNPTTKSYAFCKTSLPINQRVEDLVSRLTLDEKISQLVNTVPSIPRLGIPKYEWWSEALHGVADAGKGIRFFNGTIRSATSFPQVILTAASFDAHLWYRIGQAIGIEARAVYNEGQATGMTFWAPNINIFRDPRWGRGQETPGEDPLVTSKYAVSYVRGVQGDSFEGGKLGENLQASACCKHFTAYDLDNWKGTNRFVFDARVTAQDLADTYQPPFRSCIKEGRASGIMCAYNRVNGVPSCADHNLLSKTARGLWGFHGYITSDCDAVSIIHDNQGYAKTPEDAVGDVLKAGMDVNCGTYLQKYTKSAVLQKKVSETDINRALYNLFSIRMRLGHFNGNPKHQPLGNIGPNHVCTQEHQNLALEAARDGIVLLKNSAKLLPLSKSTKYLGIIGPNANVAKTLLGNYFGPPCKSVTPFQALTKYVKNTFYHTGCESVSCSSVNIKEAVELAKSVEYVMLIMGLDQTQEKEEKDRLDLVLPGEQQNLIVCVAKAARKPVILVILSGGPVDISFAKYDRKIGSILWGGYPGEAGGIALAEIIFGDHNPGGRLPVTWYPQEFTKVPMTDMRMRPALASGYPGRTYRFYEGKKVFKFGYGLSYSTYSYNFVSTIPNSLYFNISNVQELKKRGSDSIPYLSVSEMGNHNCESMKFSLSVEVQNSREMSGKHPVLLFVQHSEVRHGSPIEELVGFETVHLNAGERGETAFVLSPCEHLSRVNEDGLMVMEEGSYFLVVGDAEYKLTVFL